MYRFNFSYCVLASFINTSVIHETQFLEKFLPMTTQTGKSFYDKWKKTKVFMFTLDSTTPKPQ